MNATYSPFLPIHAKARVPACPGFVACDHFRIDTSCGARVKIADMMSQFNLFMKKVEKDVPEAWIEGSLQSRSVSSAEMFERFSGRAKITLSQLWHLLEVQGQGQEGTLCARGKLNLFFIELEISNVYVVSAQWSTRDGGWILGAIPLELKDLWMRWFWVFSQAK